jgi:hypothetical protein
MQAFLRKSLIVSLLALGVAVIGQNASADPGDNLHWKSVIGILAPGNVVGSGTAKATGAPGPWSAQGGSVSVDPDKGKVDFLRPWPGACRRKLHRDPGLGGSGEGNAGLRHQRQRGRWQLRYRRHAARGPG